MMKRFASLGLLAACCTAQASNTFELDYTQQRSIQAPRFLSESYDIVFRVHAEGESELDEAGLALEMQVNEFSSQLSVNGQDCGAWVYIEEATDSEDDPFGLAMLLATPKLEWHPSAECNCAPELIARIEEDCLLGDMIAWTDVLDTPTDALAPLWAHAEQLGELDPHNSTPFDAQDLGCIAGNFSYVREDIPVCFTQGMARVNSEAEVDQYIDDHFDLDAPFTDTIPLALGHDLGTLEIEASCSLRAAGTVFIEQPDSALPRLVTTFNVARSMAGYDGQDLLEASTSETLVLNVGVLQPEN